MAFPLRNLPDRVRRFFDSELWRIMLAEQPRWRRGVLRQLQFWTLVVREFAADRCLLRATALAFTTLLSLVPLLALMFAVLKSFGVQNRLQPLLLEHLSAGSDSVANAIISYINNTNVGHLSAIGLVALVVSVLSLISGIENTFNAVWGVKETRSIARRFTSYFSVVTIGPVFVVAAISMTGSLESQTLVLWLLDLALVGNLLIVLFNILPYMIMSLVFAGLYLFIPNTRVAPRAAMIGGVFGGTLWQLSQWAYVDFQVGVARYNAIYGTLAALPIFMVWLYLAWAILLLGLEVTFAVQNLQSVRRDLRGGQVSIVGRTRVILTVLLHLGCCFHRGTPPPSAETLSSELEIPPRLLHDILALLQRFGLVIEVAGDHDTNAYLLARDPDTLLLSEILGMIAGEGNSYVPSPGCAEAGVVATVIDQFAMAGSSALTGLSLRDLMEQVEQGAGKVVQPVESP